MSAIVRSPKDRNGMPANFRVYNVETRKYLHLSGTGETEGTDWAYLGFLYQAREMVKRIKATSLAKNEPEPALVVVER